MKRILERDGWRCYLCGERATSADHLTPQAFGGTDDDSNLGAICRRCQQRKGSLEGAEGRRRRRGCDPAGMATVRIDLEIDSEGKGRIVETASSELRRLGVG